MLKANIIMRLAIVVAATATLLLGSSVAAPSTAHANAVYPVGTIMHGYKCAPNGQWYPLGYTGPITQVYVGHCGAPPAASTHTYPTGTVMYGYQCASNGHWYPVGYSGPMPRNYAPYCVGGPTGSGVMPAPTGSYMTGAILYGYKCAGNGHWYPLGYTGPMPMIYSPTCAGLPTYVYLGPRPVVYAKGVVYYRTPWLVMGASRAGW